MSSPRTLNVVCGKVHLTLSDSGNLEFNFFVRKDEKSGDVLLK